MTPDFRDRSVGYVELYVCDAVRALEYFTGAFAFSARAFSESPDRYSVLLVDGSARLIVTEPRGEGPVADWLDRHGDGVRDIALYRPDLDDVIQRAQQVGLQVMLGPGLSARTGARYARVSGVGSLCHTVLGVESHADLPPGFAWRPLRTVADTVTEPAPPALESMDHVAICLPAGTLAATVATYQYVYAMRAIHTERTGTGKAAMNSVVLRDAAGLAFVMCEPDTAFPEVDQFLAAHRTAGVQRLAFLTDDLVAAVRGFGSRGVDFVPSSAHVGRDHDGALSAIFTSYPHDNDALFYALVERPGGSAASRGPRVFCSHKLRGGRCHVRSDH